jgi:hypothetical protein
MNFPKTLAVLAIGIAMTGCEPQSTTQPAKPHYQRFVPLPSDAFFVEGIPWHGYKDRYTMQDDQVQGFPQRVSD